MTRKVWTFVALAVVLGALSLYLNKDWFASDNIHIYYRSIPPRRSRQANSATDPVVFMFDRKLKLTSVKVIPLSDIQTNQHPQPIWQLVSDSNSVPVKQLYYGVRVPGMRPAVKDTRPEPLEPGVTYRLFVAAGNQKAEHDFVPRAH